MKIQDHAEAQRIRDAERHDEVFVMIGDPETGRPLIKMSVTANGDPVVEYEQDDLAAGIRAINGLLSEVINRADDNGPAVLDAVRGQFEALVDDEISVADLRYRMSPSFSTRQLGDALVRLRADGIIEPSPRGYGYWRRCRPARDA